MRRRNKVYAVKRNNLCLARFSAMIERSGIILHTSGQQLILHRVTANSEARTISREAVLRISVTVSVLAVINNL